VHPHGDVDCERHIWCYQRNGRRDEIDQKSYPKAPADAADSLSIDLGATQLSASDRRDQQVERTAAEDERAAIEGDRGAGARTSKVLREHRGRKWNERDVEECAAVREQKPVACRTDQPQEVVVGDPCDQNDEEAERERDVVGPERREAGPRLCSALASGGRISRISRVHAMANTPSLNASMRLVVSANTTSWRPSVSGRACYGAAL
jgi:hypothetical protein